MKNNLQSIQRKHKGYSKTVMFIQGSGNPGKTSDAGPYPYAGEYTAKIQHIFIYGISERQKRTHDI